MSALLRAGLTVTAAGAALAAGGGAASAAEPSRAETPLGTLDTRALHDPVDTAGGALEYGMDGSVGPVRDLQLDPLAHTGVDPVDNTAGTQIGDFRPISTEEVTGPLANGASLDELPAVDGLGAVLPG